jgi:hypothetical protein
MMKNIRKIIPFFALFLLLISSFTVYVLVDRPVEFNNPKLESIVREKLNYYSKPIYRSQLLAFVELDLSNRDIQDLTGIEHFRNLEVLNLRFNAVLDVRLLGSLKNLRILDLGYNHLTDLNSAGFDDLRNLKIVHLNLDHNTKLSGEGKEIRLSNLNPLKNFTSITNLSLVDNHIKDISPLANLSKLKELNLRENRIEDISGIRELSSMIYLNLHSNPNLLDISPIHNLVNLETLILRNVPVGDQLDAFENLTSLQRLNLRNCGISDVSFLATLMAKGALQDNPEINIQAYLDILDNNIPEDPHELRALNPYWNNIHTTYPLTLNGSILEPPSFSIEAGFYLKPFSLTLSTDQKDGVIHYTLDGSLPTKESQVYVTSIPVRSQPFDSIKTFQATVIRAKVFEKDGFDSSPTITKTYLVGPTSKTTFELPILSLVTDPDNLYDPEIGLFTSAHFKQRGKKYERSLHLEFFTPNGLKTYSNNILFRLHGQVSRNHAQKSLRLYAENNYVQQETIDYPFFPDLTGTGTANAIDQFETLILRNSGNDWRHAFLRDALIHKLVEHTTLDTQAYRPVNVFLNGQYWGILNMRERLDEFYIQNHYGIDPEDLLYYEVSSQNHFYNQDPENNEFLSLLDYIKNGNHSDAELYALLEQEIDIQNLFDNHITYLYANNGDWLINNMKFWKMDTAQVDLDTPYGQDGRWRWMINDMDFGFQDYNSDLINEMTRKADRTLIISTLLKNSDYRLYFINRYADLLNTTFLPSRVIEEIDQLAAIIDHDINYQIQRWGTMNGSKDQWYANVEVLRKFALNRPQYVWGILTRKFNLSGVATITINTNHKQGYVRINTIDIIESTPGVSDPALWSGMYFQGLPITLKAIPQPGYQFSHWEGVSQTGITDESITLTIDNDMTVTAVFEPIN